MPTVRIVTDSSCDLPQELIGDLPITVLPNRVQLGNEEFLDRLEIEPAQYQARAYELMTLPSTEPPDMATFSHAFASLSRSSGGILSIHGSARLGTATEVAGKARTYYYDRCQIVVVDSESATMGLGYIVLQAAKAAEAGTPLREIVDLVRTIIHQTHVVFVADAAEAPVVMARYQPYAAMASGGGGVAVAVAPTMPANARPVLKLEEGRIVPLEQVRNRTKALERLYEFVEIFPRVEDLSIMHGRAVTDVEWLLKRIDPIYPRKDVRVIPYGPAMAQHVGNNAVGVVAYEGLEVE